MEAPEVPTEHLHEQMHHHAGNGGWTLGVALSSAIIAGLAAMAALLAGHCTNGAMILQMLASDRWSYYQAKGVKGNVLASKMEVLAALGKAPDPKDQQKIAEYRREQESIQEDAQEKQKVAQEYLETEEAMAQAVTVFQVTIAVGAISALTRRRGFWYVSLGAAAIGLVLLLHGLMGYSRLPRVEMGEAIKTEPGHAAHPPGEGGPPAAHVAH